MTTNTQTSAAPKTTAAAKGAIALLRADHVAVSGLIADYGETGSSSNKKALFAEICTALSVHAQSRNMSNPLAARFSAAPVPGARWQAAAQEHAIASSTATGTNTGTTGSRMGKSTDGDDSLVTEE